MPKSKVEHPAAVTVTCVGKVERYKDGGKEMLVRGRSRACLAKRRQTQRDEVSASNAPSAFGGYQSFARMPAASKGKKPPARNLIFPLLFTSGNMLQN